MVTKILFVEPPKDYWFLMGEYLPPPTPLLALAAYDEMELGDTDIEILDCQAEMKDWKGVEKHIASSAPDVVASSGFTCNAYTCARVAQVAKTIDQEIITVVGGHAVHGRFLTLPAGGRTHTSFPPVSATEYSPQVAQCDSELDPATSPA